MKRTMIVVLLAFASIAVAQSASLREVIRTCGDDGKKLCDGVRYGKAMQTCLSKNREKLTPACRALVKRLDGGEKVSLF